MTSPCIKVCQMDPVRGVCIGCCRTLDEIARFPQVCTRADRRSVYAQQGLSLREAMRKEWYNGFPAFVAEGAEGAKRFASGKGRHGDFRDI